ncbi:LPXTG cell wall anchor domain-containing protein [Limosilactobacillus reuteri]|uniref:LPXTG cell wall anchor domain-containing protein n=1 Tax=Limosilactobacillus reuteri TaxID=1598 RepID=UPI003F253E65
MKTKLFLASATVLVALSLTGVASADTTRDQIEAEGNQQIQSYWNEYQQAMQDRQNVWKQSRGDRWSQAYQDADAHAGAAYHEWLEARTALGDRLHAYDVSQWEKEEQDDQPSNQTPEENSQALNTQGSQATVPTSQSATPASQAKLSSQPATQELTQQASVADPASQPITQSTAQKPQQASVSVQADKTGNLPAQNKKPVQERTEQSSVATLPQTGNQAGLGAISIGIASALAMFGLAGVKRDDEKSNS